MKSRIVKFLITVLLGASILVGIVLFVCFTSLLYIRNSGRKIEEDVETYDYQFCEYDPQSEEIFLGQVSVIDKIHNRYETYETDDGRHIMVSKPGSVEFLCQGSCMCFSPKTPSHESVRFLYSIESIYDFDLYKVRPELESICNQRMKYKCTPDLVTYDITECNVVYREKGRFGNETERFSSYNTPKPEIYTYEEEEDEDVEEEFTKEKEITEGMEEKRFKIPEVMEEKVARFWCKGTCLINTQIRLPELREKSLEVCKDLKQELEMEVKMVSEVSGREKTLPEACEEAEFKFSDLNMKLFCHEQSVHEYKFRKIFKWYSGTVHLCVSERDGQENSSVRCRFKEIV